MVTITVFLLLLSFLLVIRSFLLPEIRQSRSGILHLGTCIYQDHHAIYLSFISYCTKTYTGHLEWVRSVVSSEDGRLLVTASNDQVSYHYTSIQRLPLSYAFFVH